MNSLIEFGVKCKKLQLNQLMSMLKNLNRTSVPAQKPNTGWQRYKKYPLGYWSLILLSCFFGISLFAEVISNDKPLIIRYQNHWFFPIVHDYPETTFGGDFVTPTDYLDPFIKAQFQKKNNFAIYPLNQYGADTINYYAQAPNPAPPSQENWLGTDDRGRDIFARLLYGFRVSMLFAIVLTFVATVVGIAVGALQGYFGGKVDLLFQRTIEVWGTMPELYLLIIFASIFERSLWLLIVLLSLFAWIGTSNYVRAEFLRNRNMEYVKSAKALGLSSWQIIWRHVLPNSLTAVVTLLPFALSGAIVTLTSLDFLGLGVPPSTPSIGELLSQGKANLESWWIALATFTVLAFSLLTLTFIGDTVRRVFDPRETGRGLTH